MTKEYVLTNQFYLLQYYADLSPNSLVLHEKDQSLTRIGICEPEGRCFTKSYKLPLLMEEDL